MTPEAREALVRMIAELVRVEASARLRQPQPVEFYLPDAEALVAAWESQSGSGAEDARDRERPVSEAEKVAFTCGAKWWEYQRTGATMWPSDQDEAYEAAERKILAHRRAMDAATRPPQQEEEG